MIDADYFWRNISLLAAGTFCVRFSIIAMSSRVQISDRLREIFSFIPAAVLPALIAPMVFFHQGQVKWALGKERFLILVFATVVCYFSRSMIVTLTFGLISLYLATQI